MAPRQGVGKKEDGTLRRTSPHHLTQASEALLPGAGWQNSLWGRTGWAPTRKGWSLERYECRLMKGKARAASSSHTAKALRVQQQGRDGKDGKKTGPLDPVMWREQNYCD